MDIQTQKPETRSQVEAEEFLGVLLVDPDGADVRAVADVMAQAFGLILPDATHRARYSRGIVTRSAEPLVAQRLIAGLDQKGVGSFSVPARTFGDVPAGLPVGEMRLADDAATFTPKGTAAPVRVEWSRIDAMHVYGLERPGEMREQKDRFLHAVAERIFRDGLVRVLDEIAELRTKGKEIVFACDLLCREPGVVLRIERDLRIEAGLAGRLADGACDEEGIHTLERFIRLLEETMLRSGAYVTDAGLSFLQDLELKGFTYHREEERRNRNLWLWQMIRTGRLERSE